MPYYFCPVLLTRFQSICITTETHLLSLFPTTPDIWMKVTYNASSEQLSLTASQVKITFVVTFDIVMTTLISNGEIVIDCFLLTKLKKEMLDRLWDWKLAPMGSTAWNLGISMHLVLQMEKLTKLNWHKLKKKIYGSCKSFQKIHCC